MKLFDARRPRLTAEPVALRHAPAIQRWASDARIAATTQMPHPYPEDGAVTFVAEASKAWKAGTDFIFAICVDDEAIGTCGLKHAHQGAAELGYWVGVPFWGQGYASQAARLVAGFGFEQLGLKRVEAHVLEQNPASSRVLDKLGFAEFRRDQAPCGCGAEGDRAIFYNLPAEVWATVTRA
ncbi:MAG: GNAT family N-acetyltransferase [Bacteroidota bacterium]